MFSTNYFQVQYLIKKPKKKLKIISQKIMKKKRFRKILKFWIFLYLTW